MSDVIVSLKGGLGNQLFQYAAARALAARTGASLVLDLAWFDAVLADRSATVRPFALGPFGLKYETRAIGLAGEVAVSLLGRIRRRLLRNVPLRQNGVPVVREKSFAFDANVLDLRPSVWLDGYWQSEKYFEAIAPALRNDLATPRDTSAASQAVLNAIAVCDAICLHVRRGDYVTHQAANTTHGLCGMDYYQRGLAEVCDGLRNPHCFVFSDDPEWVRENMKLSVPMTVVDANGPNDAHQDLWLMAACRSFVIANSSLSWWGAWLGRHPDKRVVAPLKWFRGAGVPTDDLVPAGWLRR